MKGAQLDNTIRCVQEICINNTKRINQKKRAESGIARENSRLNGRLQAIKASPALSRVVQAKRHVKAARDSKGMQAQAPTTLEK